MRKTVSITAVQEAREKDTAERPKRKEVRDKRKTAQEQEVQGVPGRGGAISLRGRLCSKL